MRPKLVNLSSVDAWEMAVLHGRMGYWEEAELFLSQSPKKSISDLHRAVLLEAL